jgi:hypothetical protein
MVLSFSLMDIVTLTAITAEGLGCAAPLVTLAAAPPLASPASLATTMKTPADAATTATEEHVTPGQAMFASIAIELDGKSLTFDKACSGFAGHAGGTATAGAKLSPGRSPWLWMRGCDGQYASFYVGLTRPPEPGVSNVTIFDLQIPGMKTQELGSARADTKSKIGPQPALATFEIMQVTPHRISGTFRFEARSEAGGPFKPGRGTFDLPRTPNDTSPGP